MLKARVIPTLLLDNGGLYKTISFSKPRYIGDPINAVRIFNEKEVDELVLLDIQASKRNFEPDYDLIKTIANECFMPFAYGGGITSMVQAEKIFKIGAEKVIIGQSALTNPNLIRAIADNYGSQAVVLSVNVIKTLFGSYKLYNPAQSKSLRQDPLEWTLNLINYGVGEVLLTAVHNEGRKKGYDIDLIKKFTASIDCPLIANGGAGNLLDFKNAIDKGGASAVAAGSYFVFHGNRNAILINYPSYQSLCDLLNSDNNKS